MSTDLQIYNTLTRTKTAFSPVEPGHVRMYVCGMTVYDFCHLGHARVMVVFDLVRRWLQFSGYRVTYVRNITDIDDKIIRRAVENGESIRALTDRFIAAMHEDADRLGIERPDHEPRATDYVPQMLSMIGQLEDKGLAYRATDGDVNFAVRRFPGYGRLSGKSLDELRAGERVAVDDGKQDPLDFVLWKAAKPEEPKDAVWESGFGPGRPGWHIECSAMSCSLLGSHFDIHGGGADLQFPHHENEIAQSVGANGDAFANVWMHNGFVRVDTDGVEEKMSKSLGNFFTIRDILGQYDAEVVRFFIARAQYRSPLTYSQAHLEDAKASLTRLYTALRPFVTVKAEQAAQGATGTSDTVAGAHAGLPAFDPQGGGVAAFSAAMNDDFNTASAVSVLFELAAELNRSGSAQVASQLRTLGGVLGLLQRSPEAFLKGGNAGSAGDDADIEAEIEKRAQAKRDKNFALADDIRKALLARGIVLEDRPGGVTQWRRQ